MYNTKNTNEINDNHTGTKNMETKNTTVADIESMTKHQMNEFDFDVQELARKTKLDCSNAGNIMKLSSLYPHAEKYALAFFSYLQQHKNLLKCNQAELMACFTKSLKIELPIDGENAYIVTYSNRPTFIASYTGLINAVTAHLPGQAMIIANAISKNGFIACEKHLGRIPKYSDHLPMEYYKTQEIVTVDNTEIVIVYLVVDNVCIYERVYNRAELLERIKSLSGAWSGSQRKTDGTEMLKKTAIRHFCKTLPNMPKHIQEIL